MASAPILTFAKRFVSAHDKKPIEGRAFGDNGTTFYGLPRSSGTVAKLTARVLFEVRQEQNGEYYTQDLALEPDAAVLASMSASYDSALTSIVKALGLECDVSDPYFYPEQNIARFRVRVDSDGKPIGGDKNIKVFDAGMAEMGLMDLKVGDEVNLRLAFDSVCVYMPTDNNEGQTGRIKMVLRVSRVSVVGSKTDGEKQPDAPVKKAKADKKKK